MASDGHHYHFEENYQLQASGEGFVVEDDAGLKLQSSFNSPLTEPNTTQSPEKGKKRKSQGRNGKEKTELKQDSI